MRSTMCSPSVAAVLGCLTLAATWALAQAQPRPATMQTYYPRGYTTYAPPAQGGLYYAPLYTTYYYPAPDFTAPLYNPYYSPAMRGYDPGFRSFYYAPGPANFFTGLNDYYASPRYWNYYYAGY